MMRHATPTFLLIVATLALPRSSTWGVDTPAATTEQSRPDVVCGPRCVQFILKQYGKQVELHDLIQEIQWPHLEAGSNLADLQKSLNKRGIHTAAIQISSGAKLDWTEPVLVHLKPGISITPETLGHFVVWLPSSTSDIVHLWFGPKGIHQGSNNRFASIRSGAVLLTSQRPIDQSSLAISRSISEWWAWMFLVGGLASVLLSLAYRLVVHRRANF